MASSEEAHHHTQRIETQVADGKMTCPPSANTNEKQEVNGWEGRWQCDPYKEKVRGLYAVHTKVQKMKYKQSGPDKRFMLLCVLKEKHNIS